MNARDIIIANLEHRNPPRPGMSFDGGRMNDFLGAGIAAPSTYKPERWQDGPFEHYYDIWGNTWRRLIGGSIKGEIHQPLIQDWSQLDSLEAPNYDDESLYEGMRKAFAQPSDKFKLAGIGGWVFDDARYLRKMEVYFTDLHMYPDEIRRLHEIVASTYEAKIHWAGRLKADGIMIGEDLGTQTGLLIGPETWRTYYADLYKRLFGIAHDYGMKILMHSCGYNMEIVDDLAAAGIDCFQFDQPALYDMPALAEKLRRHKAALWSPVDIQKVLPTGDRALIESEAHRMVDTFRGFLIAKNYPDLPGIGVRPEWDQWAYDAILDASGITPAEAQSASR